MTVPGSKVQRFKVKMFPASSHSKGSAPSLIGSCDGKRKPRSKAL